MVIHLLVVVRPGL